MINVLEGIQKRAALV